MRTTGLLTATALALIASPAVAQFTPTYTSARIQFTLNTFKNFGADPQTVAGQRQLVWAGSEGVPGVGVGFYIPCCRDPLSRVEGSDADPDAYPHNKQWFYKYHPDWLMYEADKTTISKGGNDNLFQLDVMNPEVREYMAAYALGQCPASTAVYSTCAQDIPADRPKKGAIPGNFTLISFDNLAPFNGADTVGYYKNASKNCTNPPACGGQWTQRYDPAGGDTKFGDDMFDWATWFKDKINDAGIGLWTNNKVNKNYMPQSYKLSGVGDFNLRESSYLHACVSPGVNRTKFIGGDDWLAQLKIANYTYNKPGLKGVVHHNLLCMHPANQATAAEQYYAVANYYMIRDPKTFFEMQNGDRYGIDDQGSLNNYSSAINIYLGQPSEPPPDPTESHPSGGECWQRRYTFGRVIVWPHSTGSCTYTVPGGDTWTTMFGQSVTGNATRTLSPDTSSGVARPNAMVLKQGTAQ